MPKVTHVRSPATPLSFGKVAKKGNCTFKIDVMNTYERSEEVMVLVVIHLQLKNLAAKWMSRLQDTLNKIDLIGSTVLGRTGNIR